MNKFFNFESPVMQFLMKVSDLILLNILTVLCSLPIVTGGAAMAGLYYAVGHLQEDKGSAVKDFFAGFRSNFRQATALWAIWLGSFMVIAGALWLYISQNGITSALRIPGLLIMEIAAIIWILGVSWVFPLQASFHNTVKGTLQNALRCGCANPLKSLVMTALNLIPLLCWFFRPDDFWRFAVVWVAIWYALAAYLIRKMAKKVFDGIF